MAAATAMLLLNGLLLVLVPGSLCEESSRLALLKRLLKVLSEDNENMVIKRSDDPGCNGVAQELVGHAYGTVTNPSLADVTYPPNRDCKYIIKVPEGQNVRIRFKKLNMEYEEKCSYDFLNFYDGPVVDKNFLLAWYCGKWDPVPKDVLTSGNILLIYFHSDADNSGTGFDLAFNSGPATCGTTRYDNSKRISGGTASQQNQWPWLVHMRTTYPVTANKPGFYQQCGGALITDQWVLTAAHCMEFKQVSDRTADVSRITLYIGEHNTGDSFYKTAKASLIIFHPGRAGFGVGPNDVALIKLESPVTIDDPVNPVCLPLDSKQFPPGTTCTVAGWGRQHNEQALSKTLMHVNLDVIENSACHDLIGNEKWAIPVSQDHLCAMGSGTQSHCEGDSGGPLVCKEDGRHFVAGIVSFMRFCGKYTSPSPSVYARVANYNDWILETIQAN